MRAERARLSRHADVAKAMDYMLKRWPAFEGVVHDGRICLTNNAAERALRGIALGRKAWLFAGLVRGGEPAAVMYTLIQTARLNGVDPQAWLADVLARINEPPPAIWMPCCRGTGGNLPPLRSPLTPPTAVDLSPLECRRPRPDVYKSLVLTDEGLRQSEALFRTLFTMAD